MRNLAMISMILGALLTSAVGCAADSGDDTDATNDELRNGTVTLDHPEIGKFIGGGGCTATLVRPTVVLTAAHCVPGAGGGTEITGGWSFTITTADNAAHVYKIDKFQSVLQGSDFHGGDSWRVHDIALLHLTQSVPAAVAHPAGLATSWPLPGERVATWGYGCTQLGTHSFGTKRKHEFNWTIGEFFGVTFSADVCPGDSGGPFFDLGRNVVLGTNSGSNAQRDYFGDVANNMDRINPILRSWGAQ